MLPLADLHVAPTLDVHGYDIAGALFEIDAFCERSWGHGLRAVKIIHGRGQGKLREGILAWVRQQVHLAVEDSTILGETGAVLYLYLR